MMQDGVNIDRAALDPGAIDEDLHAIDQRADPVGFLDNQPGQLPVLRIGVQFQ